MAIRNDPFKENGLLERHLTSKELAELWNMSTTAIYRMFYDEPGVLKLGSTSKRFRTRRELRIPQSVAERVYGDRINRS